MPSTAKPRTRAGRVAVRVVSNTRIVFEPAGIVRPFVFIEFPAAKTYLLVAGDDGRPPAGSDGNQKKGNFRSQTLS